MGSSVKNKWLLDFAMNKSSQSGEDGIIEKALEVIGESTGWCVEFGAWDGRHLSNTYQLITDKGYSAVLIEGSDERFRDLVDTFHGNTKVFPVCAFVGFNDFDGLDAILARTPIPHEFDLLSIDIDGNDYHVWKAFRGYRPRIMVIEYNPTVPSCVDFVQPADMAINQGASILALKSLGLDKGYELISITENNCIFVRSEFFERFEISDNSVDALRPNEKMVTHIFSGMDGTIFLRGFAKLPWIGFPVLERDIQQVPRWLRQFPSNFGPFKKLIAQPYRSWRKRRS